MRNESTNDRLIALETQMKILSARKSCVDTSSPSNYDKTSEKPMTDSVVPIKKTGKSLENRPDFPKGENHFRLSLKQGTGNGGTRNEERGTGNGESLKGGISKRRNL